MVGGGGGEGRESVNYKGELRIESWIFFVYRQQLGFFDKNVVG